MKKAIILLLAYFCLVTICYAETGTLWIPCDDPVTEGDEVTLSLRPTGSSGEVLKVSTMLEDRESVITSDQVYRIRGVSTGGVGVVSYSYPVDIDFWGFGCEKVRDELTFNAIMALAGVIAGGLVFYGVLSAFLN